MGTIEIPIFHGEDPESWVLWIEDFVSAQGFSDFETRQFAYGFIGGDAHRWYCDEVSRSGFRSWEDLKFRLLQRFGKSGEDVKKQEEPNFMDWMKKLSSVLDHLEQRWNEEDGEKKQRVEETWVSEAYSNQFVSHDSESLEKMDPILESIQRMSMTEVKNDLSSQRIEIPGFVSETTVDGVACEEIAEEEDPFGSVGNLFQKEQSGEQKGNRRKKKKRWKKLFLKIQKHLENNLSSEKKENTIRNTEREVRHQHDGNKRAKAKRVEYAYQVFDQMPLGGEKLLKKRKRKRWRSNVKVKVKPYRRTKRYRKAEGLMLTTMTQIWNRHLLEYTAENKKTNVKMKMYKPRVLNGKLLLNFSKKNGRSRWGHKRKDIESKYQTVGGSRQCMGLNLYLSRVFSRKGCSRLSRRKKKRAEWRHKWVVKKRRHDELYQELLLTRVRVKNTKSGMKLNSYPVLGVLLWLLKLKCRLKWIQTHAWKKPKAKHKYQNKRKKKFKYPEKYPREWCAYELWKREQLNFRFSMKEDFTIQSMRRMKGYNGVKGCCIVLGELRMGKFQVKKKKSQFGNKAECYQVRIYVMHISKEQIMELASLLVKVKHSDFDVTAGFLSLEIVSKGETNGMQWFKALGSRELKWKEGVENIRTQVDMSVSTPLVAIRWGKISTEAVTTLIFCLLGSKFSLKEKNKLEQIEEVLKLGTIAGQEEESFTNIYDILKKGKMSQNYYYFLVHKSENPTMEFASSLIASKHNDVGAVCGEGIDMLVELISQNYKEIADFLFLVWSSAYRQQVLETSVNLEVNGKEQVMMGFKANEVSVSPQGDPRLCNTSTCLKTLLKALQQGEELCNKERGSFTIWSMMSTLTHHSLSCKDACSTKQLVRLSKGMNTQL